MSSSFLQRIGIQVCVCCLSGVVFGLAVVGGAGVGTCLAVAASLAVVAAIWLVVWPRHDARRALLWGSATVSLASWALSLVSAWGGLEGQFSVMEAASLLVLVVLVSRRRSTGRPESAVLVALVLAVVAVPWREPGPHSAFYMSLVAFAAAVSVIIGWSLRESEETGERKLAAVLAAERQDIARDLHDDLAHHVTGILVMAQAAALTTGPDPAARAAFDQIERASVEALESMRRIVSVLRIDDGEVAAARRGPDWPADLEALTQRFEHTTGVKTQLTVEVGDVPPVHRQAVLRVIQEALTNVSRHARDVTRAVVRVDRDRRGLRVVVTDDGRAETGDGPRSTPRNTATGGGFGLIGLRERAKALGGKVRAGRSGGGWQVEVSLPLTPDPLETPRLGASGRPTRSGWSRRPSRHSRPARPARPARAKELSP
ncbi:hypothetical protein JCM9957A_18360 [Kineosporia succinea]|uniref:histidine kinase n=1 Tax=Kineosporia succinea TaxID=84632 RepID=A0ABT9PED8_9ACTN|nr:sensor histidine kinase [Kineosporia succinea]MDP9830759.1 signal transduction histidine kinase [Kineosporia succinea]